MIYFPDTTNIDLEWSDQQAASCIFGPGRSACTAKLLNPNATVFAVVHLKSVYAANIDTSPQFSVPNKATSDRKPQALRPESFHQKKLPHSQDDSEPLVYHRRVAITGRCTSMTCERKQLLVFAFYQHCKRKASIEERRWCEECGGSL